MAMSKTLPDCFAAGAKKQGARVRIDPELSLIDYQNVRKEIIAEARHRDLLKDHGALQRTEFQHRLQGFELVSLVYIMSFMQLFISIDMI